MFTDDLFHMMEVCRPKAIYVDKTMLKVAFEALRRGNSTSSTVVMVYIWDIFL